MKGTFSGSLERHGFRKVVGPTLVLFCSALLYLAHTGQGDADMVKLFSLAPLAGFGLLGTLFPDVAASLVGIKLSSASEKILWLSQNTFFVAISVMGYTLFYTDEGIVAALRNANAASAALVLLYKFTLADTIKASGMTPKSYNLTTGIFLAIAALLALDEK